MLTKSSYWIRGSDRPTTSNSPAQGWASLKRLKHFRRKANQKIELWYQKGRMNDDALLLLYLFETNRNAQFLNWPNIPEDLSRVETLAVVEFQNDDYGSRNDREVCSLWANSVSEAKSFPPWCIMLDPLLQQINKCWVIHPNLTQGKQNSSQSSPSEEKEEDEDDEEA